MPKEETFYELKIDKNGDTANLKVKVKKCLDNWDTNGHLVSDYSPRLKSGGSGVVHCVPFVAKAVFRRTVAEHYGFHSTSDEHSSRVHIHLRVPSVDDPKGRNSVVEHIIQQPVPSLENLVSDIWIEDLNAYRHSSQISKIGLSVSRFCKGDVKQFYECQKCQTKSTIGELKLRKYVIGNKEIIYEEAEKQSYISQKVERKIVVKPVSLNDFWIYSNLIGLKTWEIYNNSDDKDIIVALHQKLLNDQMVLVGIMGFKSRYSTEVPIVITPFKDRLIVKELLDISLVRDANQKDISLVKTAIDEFMSKVCQDRLGQLKNAYIDKKLKNETIDVEPKVSEEIKVNQGKAIALINSL